MRPLPGSRLGSRGGRMRFGADPGSQGRGWWGRGWGGRLAAPSRVLREVVRGRGRLRTRLLQPQNTRDSFFRSPTSKSWKRVPTSPGRGGSYGKEGRSFSSECQPVLAKPRARGAPCSYPASRRPRPLLTLPRGHVFRSPSQKRPPPRLKMKTFNRRAGPRSLERRLQQAS